MPEGSSMSSKCHMLRVDPFCTFCHHTITTKRTFSDTTVGSEIIKKRKKAKENTLPLFYV
jgi:hypothetical protein